MLPSVYVETTIVSYLVARPSRDPVMAERQCQTREWWETWRGEYRLFSSERTQEEAQRGEPLMARRRLAVLAGMQLIPTGDEVIVLAEALLTRGSLPMRARSDALHIAAAAVGRMDYLLTWDRRHIANSHMKRRRQQLLREYGCELPILCTPEELLRR